MGDLNEDFLNPNNQNLKSVLLINSLNNIITEPTRGRTLLDLVLTSFEQTVLDCGILQVPPEISDHFATFVTLPFEYSVHPYKRKIWIYRQANYIEIETRINNFDWSPLHSLSLVDAVWFFNDTFLKFVNECISSKEVTLRRDDKPWYDTENRNHSRKRDRLKPIAYSSNRPSNWRKFKATRNKVNNLKKHAKERFYNNLELNLTENFTKNNPDVLEINTPICKKKTILHHLPFHRFIQLMIIMK